MKEPFGVVFQEDGRLPEQFRGGDGLQHLEDGGIGHVPLSRRGQRPVERHFEARGLAMSAGEDAGGVVRSHRVRGRGTFPDFIEFPE